MYRIVEDFRLFRGTVIAVLLPIFMKGQSVSAKYPKFSEFGLHNSFSYYFQ